MADSTSLVMQSEEETLEQTTNATNEERTIGQEENVEATKDDDTLGSKPKSKADKSKDGLLQTQLGFVSSSVDPSACPSLYVGKFDMEEMKESVAHWTMMHEHPFSIVEEEGFNLMQRRGMPEWRGMTRNTAKAYCIIVYESENKKLKSLLKMSTKSASQWTKHVLNFVHIPPPRQGLEIANAIWRCLEDWGIEKDWRKAEKVCSVLELFWTATHIISGSDDPTSNLFLNEVSRVKVLLYKKTLENDMFIRDMVARMKVKFDKYWGETNLLMSIAAVLDPRCKLRALEFCFPRLYSSENVER
ncbi:Zinc finger BED domain-containing protein RICESLEEPER 1 [Sesamum alatum]|uniref:Zinc finger BED domain-containing protein RICESLEEPER 1 n=1 Tax=Sesamum alatum TaxID=300844 RepID=A0AAE1XNL7_9LAMI|nr:Zinc finger BED domain-containing protein RICESLEEPER 1 [Sesamum alatum]